MKLLLSPHNDDECLFAAYTLMREKPLVIIATDSDVQEGLGYGVTAGQRREESRRGCEVLGVAVVFLGLIDGHLDETDLRERLAPFTSFDWKRVYAPAIQGGHIDHDVLGKVASLIFPNVDYYSTYLAGQFTPIGQRAIIPTSEEIDLKNKALDCYATQIRINPSHFDGVRGKSEYLNDTPYSWRQ